MFAKRSIGVWVALLALASLLAVGTTLAQQAAKIELMGKITAKAADSITVNSYVIQTKGAKVKGTLDLNVNVKVEGTLQSDGTIQASEINVVSSPAQTAEFVGIVDSISGNTLVVNGQTLDTTGAHIQGKIEVGSTVQVELKYSDKNVWVVREVKVLGTTPKGVSSEDFEIVGTVTEVNGNSIVIAGQTIDITGAEVKGALKVDETAKAHVKMVNDKLTATEVEVLSPKSSVTPEATDKPEATATAEHGGQGSNDQNSQDHQGGQSSSDNGKDHSGNSGDNGKDHGGNSGDNHQGEDHSGNSGNKGDNGHSGG